MNIKKSFSHLDKFTELQTKCLLCNRSINTECTTAKIHQVQSMLFLYFTHIWRHFWKTGLRMLVRSWLDMCAGLLRDRKVAASIARSYKMKGDTTALTALAQNCCRKAVPEKRTGKSWKKSYTCSNFGQAINSNILSSFDPTKNNNTPYCKHT